MPYILKVGLGLSIFFLLYCLYHQIAIRQCRTALYNLISILIASFTALVCLPIYVYSWYWWLKTKRKYFLPVLISITVIVLSIFLLKVYDQILYNSKSFLYAENIQDFNVTKLRFQENGRFVQSHKNLVNEKFIRGKYEIRNDTIFLDTGIPWMADSQKYKELYIIKNKLYPNNSSYLSKKHKIGGMQIRHN